MDNDQSLVASMAARLTKVEKINNEQVAQLAKKDAMIKQLQAEVNALRQKVAVDSEESVSMGAKHCTECDRNKKLVKEMMDFLTDHGLSWVGDGSSSSDCEEGGSAELACQESSLGGLSNKEEPHPTDQPVTQTLDIKVIEAKVQALNDMVDSDSQITNQGMVARLSVNNFGMPLPLIFFADGLKLGDRAFQQFNSPTSQHLIRDILEGYFPYVLKDDFPNGVELKVVNRTAHAYHDWLSGYASADKDLVDNGDRLAPVGGHAIGQAKGAKEQLLAKLPEKVIRQGQVCDVRDDVAKKLGIGSAARNSSAPAANRCQQIVSLLKEGRQSTSPVARLQVKVEGGERIIFEMEHVQTVGDLEDAVVAWCSEHNVPIAASSQIVLRTAFPPQAYCDRSKTLADVGLIPTASLFVGNK